MSTDNKPTTPKTAEEVRALLVQKRTELNLSQAKIAKQIGFNNSSFISEIERGGRKIPIKKKDLFAQAYQLSEETLEPIIAGKKRLVSGVKRGEKISKEDLNIDVLPLIKILATSKKEKVTVLELREFIKIYTALRKSTNGLSLEAQEILVCALRTPAGPPAN